MAERIWSYQWNAEVRERGWGEFTVTTIETPNRDALDWCLMDDQRGWFTTWLEGGMSGTVGQPKHWAFTDPDVAFYFKMKFANGIPK